MRILVALMLLSLVAIETTSAFAQSLRDEFNQLVFQLRSNPSNHSVRERIIRLAQEIKPPPAMPEEAERRMARGTAAFRGAKSAADYGIAAREFEAATNAAPWLADAYFNLGMAQDKAGDHASAIASLKLAMLADPQSRETKNLLYQVEFRREQAASPIAMAQKRQEQDEILIRSLDGAQFVREEMSGGRPFQRYVVEIRGQNATYKSVYLVGGVHESIDGTCQLKGLECELTPKWAYQEPTRLVLKIAPGGQEAVYSRLGSGILRQEMRLRRAR